MRILDINSWDKILDNMIIIGGSARSGTTIMGKLVNSFQNTEYYFEPPMLISILLKDNELEPESVKELLEFYFIDNFLLDCLAGRNINLNKNDDSCILHVKSEEEINKRCSKSLKRVELEKIVKKSNFCFKLPEITFFLQKMNKLFPNNKTILMHRNPNDVINSLMKKGWFSNNALNINNPTQIYAIEVIDNIKIPYWIKDEDKILWVKMNELNRCAYYYMRISEKILQFAPNSLIVDYDMFIKNPKQTVSAISKKFNLKMTDKTFDILENVKYQEKKRDYLLLDLSKELKESILQLNEKLIDTIKLQGII